jgi:hypothetical protein
MFRHASAAAGSASRPTRKIQCRSALSMMIPERGRPMPPPMPNVALSEPIATGTRSAGKVSRMIPNASGKTPPATPWIARPRTSTSIEGASAQTIEPAANTTSTRTSIRALPKRSPSLPMSGVATDALSRKPVSTQLAVAAEVSNSPAMTVSAGATIVCRSAKARPDSSRAARIGPVRGTAGTAGTETEGVTPPKIARG